MGKDRRTPVVAVINMKGGVGKTVLSGNVFREVFEHFKVSTLLIDFDAQFNLSQLLLTQADYNELEKGGRTIYNVLEPPDPDSVFAVSDEALANVDDVQPFTTEIEKHSTAPAVSLRLVPGHFRLALLNVREQPALRLPRLRFRSFIERAKQEYGLIVLDCNPSSSFITLSALEVATHLLVPVKADRFALLGVGMLTRFIGLVPTIPDDIEMLIALNDIGDKSDSRVVADLRGHATYGPMVLGQTVPHTEFLAPKSDYTGFAVDRAVAHRFKIKAVLEAIASEIAGKIGIR